jgi:hypothetical protein
MSENWADYDGVMGELEKDNRTGDHDFMVSEVIGDTWPSGDARWKVKGVLLTANQAKCDLQWSPPPPASVVKQEMSGWEAGKRRGIAQAINLAKKLAESYGKRIEDLKAGDVIRVKTVKTKIDADGKGGFIRVAAILPKEEVGKSSIEAAKAASDIPF